MYARKIPSVRMIAPKPYIGSKNIMAKRPAFENRSPAQIRKRANG